MEILKILFGIVCIAVAIFGTIIIISLIAAWIKEARGEKPAEKPKPQRPRGSRSKQRTVTMEILEDREDDSDTTYGPNCYVAGLSYRWNPEEKYLGMGFLIPEPDNKYDKNAIAIYTGDGRHAGYWPRRAQGKLADWMYIEEIPRGSILPCGMEITQGDDGNFRSNITPYRPTSENYIRECIESYIRWRKAVRRENAATRHHTIPINLQ